MSNWIDYGVLVSALGSGLMAGFLFAFSVCVMRALGTMPPEQGITAMKSINVVIINPWFIIPFLGMALLSLIMIVAAFLRWHKPGAAYILAGGLLYFLGTFVVTMLFNVPRNNALAAVEATSAEGSALWAVYLITWVRWNHVRVIAGVASAASFSFALTR